MKKTSWIAAAVVVAVLLLVGGYLVSPLLAMNGLRDAVRAGDRDKLERLVDFPSVRDGLKSQFRAEIVRSLQADKELQDNPLAGLAMLAAPAIIDRALDAAVTPDGLSNLIRQGRIQHASPPSPAASGAAGAPAATTPPAGRPVSLKTEHLRYADLNTFKADVVPANGAKGRLTLVMGREGVFGWKLKRVDLPPNFMGRRVAGS